MARHRKKRFFKREEFPKESENTKDSTPQEFETMITGEDNTMQKKTIKSWLSFGTKYIYIIAIAALLSGVFTPFTLGIDPTDLILGMISLFVGVGGGVLIFKGLNRQNTSTAVEEGRTVLILLGLAFITISLIFVYQISIEGLKGVTIGI